MVFDSVSQRVDDTTDYGLKLKHSIQKILNVNESLMADISSTKQQLRECMQQKKINLEERIRLQRNLQLYRFEALKNGYRQPFIAESSIYNKKKWDLTMNYKPTDYSYFQESRERNSDVWDLPFSTTVKDLTETPVQVPSLDYFESIIDFEFHRLVHDITVNHKMTSSPQETSNVTYMLTTETSLFYRLYNLHTKENMFYLLQGLLCIIREHLHAMHWGLANRTNQPFNCKMLIDFLDDTKGKLAVTNIVGSTFHAQYTMRDNYAMLISMTFDTPPILVGKSIPNSKFLSVYLTQYMRHHLLMNRLNLNIQLLHPSGILQSHEFDMFQAFQKENVMMSSRTSLPVLNDIGITLAEGGHQNVITFCPRVNGKRRPYNEAEMTAIMANMMHSVEHDPVHDTIPAMIMQDFNAQKYTHCLYRSARFYTYYLVVLDLHDDPAFAQSPESVYTYLPYQVFFIATPNHDTFVNARQNTKMWIYQTKQARQALPIIDDNIIYAIDYLNPANFGIGLRQYLNRKREKYQPGRKYPFYLNSMIFEDPFEICKKEVDEHTWGILDEVRVRCQVITSVFANRNYDIQLFYEYRKQQLSTKIGGRQHLFRRYINKHYSELQPVWSGLIIKSLDALGHPIETWESYQENRT